MNLDAIRRILLMTPAEAAKILAATDFSPEGVSGTTWNRWAAGVKPLPDDIYDRIDTALAKRAKYLFENIDILRKKLAQNETVTVSWPQRQSGNIDPLEWYLMRSAHAELIALGADSEMVDDG